MATVQLQQGATGKQVGQIATAGSGEFTEMLVTELQPRFYEQVYRGNVFSIGCQLTPLSAATILLTASAQPIVGVGNPSTSGVNVVPLQATLIDELNNVTSVALGAFVWASSIGNTATLTAGLAPFNRKTLVAVGSQCKAFSLSTASLLTGLVNNLVIFDAAEFNTSSGLLTTTVAAATPTPSVSGVQNFDGSLIVPPGGVLALLNTVSTVTHSVAARLMWMEIPV
jgi:hypothetical protein